MRQVIAGILAGVLALSIVRSAAADGFHSPLLTKKDPRKWAQTLRESLGLDRTDSAEASLPPGAARAGNVGRQLVDVLSTNGLWPHGATRTEGPRPGEYTMKPLGKVHRIGGSPGADALLRATLFSDAPGRRPGRVEPADGRAGWEIATGSGLWAIDEVQPAGKRRMQATEWIRGRGISVGARFT